MSTDKNDAASSEYTTESSEYIEQTQEASLFGNSRTRLRWMPSSKTMNLDVRQTLQNRRNMELRFKARLNTNTGAYTHIAQLQKNMHQNTPAMARLMAAERGIKLEGEQSIDPDRFLPGGLRSLVLKDWTLAPGVRFYHNTSASSSSAATETSSSSSSSSDLKYFVTLRKQPQVLVRRGVWDTWMTGKADLELDAQQQRVGVRGSLRLKAFRFNVTDKQDLQMACGYDYSIAAGSRSATPYLMLGENSWCVKLQNGLWSFNYEI